MVGSVENEVLVSHRSGPDPGVVCGNVDSYRNFIESSMAEWSVAKNAYVAMRSGWFSDRSACYLAAGRPVVVQNTGFDAVLPTVQDAYQNGRQCQYHKHYNVLLE